MAEDAYRERHGFLLSGYAAALSPGKRALCFLTSPTELSDLTRIFVSGERFCRGNQGDDMTARNQGTQLRRIVAKRLDRFFASWLAQLGAGTAALWEQVERRLAGPATPRGSIEPDAPPVMHVPMQQQAPRHQPAQQQQQKKKDEP
jgi:hypothetical protein